MRRTVFALLLVVSCEAQLSCTSAKSPLLAPLIFSLGGGPVSAQTSPVQTSTGGTLVPARPAQGAFASLPESFTLQLSRSGEAQLWARGERYRGVVSADRVDLIWRNLSAMALATPACFAIAAGGGTFTARDASGTFLVEVPDVSVTSSCAASLFSAVRAAITGTSWSEG